MIYFKHSEVLYLLLLLLPALFLLMQKTQSVLGVFSKEVFDAIKIKNGGFSKKTRSVLLLLSLVFLILSLARPIKDNGVIKIHSSFIDMVVALDISKSMQAQDIYPNRFRFAQNKFFTLLSDVKNVRIGVVGFSSQPFLISPLTSDFNSLKFLVKNMNFKYLNIKGTNILQTLKASNELLKNAHDKIVLLFTDGGDSRSFTDAINYAKTHKITVYIYNIGTKKGGIIKDDNSNVVLVKLNEHIKNLAIKSGGAYLKSTLSKNDIKLLSSDIRAKFDAKEGKSDEIRDVKELFYYPLMVGVLLFFMAVFSLFRRRV